MNELKHSSWTGRTHRTMESAFGQGQKYIHAIDIDDEPVDWEGYTMLAVAAVLLVVVVMVLSAWGGWALIGAAL